MNLSKVNRFLVKVQHFLMKPEPAIFLLLLIFFVVSLEVTKEITLLYIKRQCLQSRVVDIGGESFKCRSLR